jgi:molecular chaperone GrpE
MKTGVYPLKKTGAKRIDTAFNEHILLRMSEDKKAPNGDDAENEVEKLKAELEKAKNEYLYLRADFDNFRKNSIKERSDLMKYGSERLIGEFLGVLDNFERALQMEVKDGNWTAFREGVQLIAGEIKSLLQRSGVEEVKAEGEEFDPAKHEALSSEPRTDMPAGHVARVFKKAYKMHDKLIRPAQVTVATAPTEN